MQSIRQYQSISIDERTSVKHSRAVLRGPEERERASPKLRFINLHAGRQSRITSVLSDSLERLEKPEKENRQNAPEAMRLNPREQCEIKNQISKQILKYKRKQQLTATMQIYLPNITLS